MIVKIYASVFSRAQMSLFCKKKSRGVTSGECGGWSLFFVVCLVFNTFVIQNIFVFDYSDGYWQVWISSTPDWPSVSVTVRFSASIRDFLPSGYCWLLSDQNSCPKGTIFWRKCRITWTNWVRTLFKSKQTQTKGTIWYVYLNWYFYP